MGGKYYHHFVKLLFIILSYSSYSVVANDDGSRDSYSSSIKPGITKLWDTSNAAHEQWHVLADSSWKNYSDVLNIIICNIKNLQIEFGISIHNDRGKQQVLMKGDKDNRNRFKVFLYNRMLRKLKPFQQDSKDIFCIGLSYESNIILRKVIRYPNLSYISTQDSLSSKSTYRIIKLVRKALHDAKEKIQLSALSNSLCCIMLHGGKMFSKMTSGTYTMKDVFVNSQQHMVYKRLVQGDLDIQKITGFHHIRTVYRYDMVIYTPEPMLRCRCKLYLRRDQNSAAFITCKEAGDSKPSFSNIPAWPVYFDIPGQKISRLDIVDPRNGLTTRVSVSVFEVDKEFESQLQTHLDVLQEKVFDNIKIKEGTVDLDIPGMPDGYLLCYLRRSERKSYRLPVEGNRTILTTSTEKILCNYETTDDSEVMDIFIDDENIMDTLDHTDWEAKQVADDYQRVINLGNDYLQMLHQGIIYIYVTGNDKLAIIMGVFTSTSYFA